MQSQLIQFFDIKSAIARNHLNHSINANQTNGNDIRNTDDFILNSNRFNDTKAGNLMIQNNNATNATVDELIETVTVPTTTIAINDEQNMSNSTLHVARKRKRTANTVLYSCVVNIKFYGKNSSLVWYLVQCFAIFNFRDIFAANEIINSVLSSEQSTIIT